MKLYDDENYKTNEVIINYLESNWDFLSIDGEGFSTPQHRNLAMVSVWGDCLESMIRTIKEEEYSLRKPIVLRMDIFFEYCVDLLYANGVTNTIVICDFIIGNFSNICVLGNMSYNVNPVIEGNSILFVLN